MIRIGKIVTILLWALLLISAVLLISLMVNIDENLTDAVMGGWINTNLVWTYILLAIGAGIAVVSAILHTVTDKDAAKQGLISLVFFVVVIGIAYILASDAIPTFYGVEKYVKDGTLTPNISKLIGTGLYTTYIMLFLAVIGMASGSVVKLFK